MLNIMFFIVAVFLLLCLFLYIQQDKLIFIPRPIDRDVYNSFKENEIEIGSSGQKLHGWRIPLKNQHNKVIIYFGGNAEDVVFMNYEAQRFNAQELYAVNYPGYGKSEGSPSQISLYENALSIYDYITKYNGVKSENIIIIGRSLGSSVASYLAAQRDAAALILITPFDSMQNVASNHYRFFPVSILLKHKFPTIDYIVKVQYPILILAAEKDEVIAQKNLHNLHASVEEDAHLIQYKGHGHNNIQSHGRYYSDINNFIDSLE